MSDQRPEAPGWYPHPTARKKYGYFNSTTWDKDVYDKPPSSQPTRAVRPSPKRPARAPRAASSLGRKTSATDCILVGLLFSVLGAVFVNQNPSLLGYLVLGVGTAWLQVGLIAKGVQIGLRS